MGGIDDITSLLERTERLNTALRDGTLIRSAVVLHEREVLEANRDNLYAGRDANNVTISPPYKPSTVRWKKSKRQPYDRVTLLDTGEFYDRFMMLYGDDEFEITSDDWKTGDLTRKYGLDIFGLNEQRIHELSESIKDTLLKDINILYSE